MAGIAHMALGFAAKPLAPEIPVGLLALAGEGLDMVWAGAWLLGLEKMGSVPWISHGLALSLAWSAAAFLIALAATRKARPALVLGLVVFSHWILDFITHPMGALTGDLLSKPDLPVFLWDSRLVGLGLYNHSAVLAYVFESALTVAGIAVYVLYTAIRRRAAKKALAGVGRNAHA